MNETFYAEDLPPLTQRYLVAADELARRTWIQRYAASFLYFANALALGLAPHPRCTGEEMALHVLLDIVAGDISDIEDLRGGDLDYRAIMSLDRALSDELTYAEDTWFQDDDVLSLFDPAFDAALADPALAGQLGTVNLNPHDWFIPFI